MDLKIKSIDNMGEKWYYALMKMSLRIFTTILVSALLLAGIGIYLAQAQKPVENAVNAPQQDIPLDSNRILLLVNAQREKVGVAPLINDPRLVAVAQARADDMVARNYFAHRDPVTNENMVKAQPFCVYASENIVWIKYETPQEDNREAVNWWLTSQPHREAMLDPKYTLTGIGIKDKRIVQSFCQTN